MRTNRFAVFFLITALAGTVTGQNDKNERQVQAALQAATNKELVDGNLDAAIEQYKQIVERYGKTNRAAVAKALLQLGRAYEKLGNAESQKAYSRIVRDFGDQKDVADVARTRLAALEPLTATQTKQAARQVPMTGNEFHGTPSPDGRYWSFTDSATGDVAVRDLVTGANHRVTNTGGWASGEYTDVPVVSSDGGQVAWVHYIDKENKVELRVASVAAGEGGRYQVVLRTAQNDGAYKIAWMPDGKQLVILRARPDRTSQIGTVTIQDGSFRNIKSLEWRKPNLLSLSPDGRYVAYDVPAGEAGAPRDIMVLATDGSHEIAVVQNPANDSFPLWSPDGSHLLFLSDRTGSNALWMAPIENGRANGPAVSIKTDVGAITLVGMTKSGTLYYSESNASRPNLYVVDLEAMRATKPPVPLTERLINGNVGSTLSRDGEYLAYYSFRNIPANTPSGFLVVRSAKTGDERTVPLPTRVTGRFGAGPKWFPDNRSVLVESGDAQGPGFGFYRLALDTGNTELLAHLPSDVPSYDLSSDGRTIFYAFNSDEGAKLVRLDIDSHRETELKSQEWEVVSLAVSPDGTQLATTLIGGVVEVMPAAGGQSREVFRPATPEIGTGALRQALAWTPDQRFLLFVQGDGALWKVPIAGGSAEKVGISMQGLKSLAIYPDGKRLVFSGNPGSNTSKAWALDNYLSKVNAKK